MSKKNQCSQRLGPTGAGQCQNKACVERDGVKYCSKHDPGRWKARRALAAVGRDSVGGEG